MKRPVLFQKIYVEKHQNSPPFSQKPEAWTVSFPCGPSGAAAPPAAPAASASGAATRSTCSAKPKRRCWRQASLFLGRVLGKEDFVVLLFGGSFFVFCLNDWKKIFVFWGGFLFFDHAIECKDARVGCFFEDGYWCMAIHPFALGMSF